MKIFLRFLGLVVLMGFFVLNACAQDLLHVRDLSKIKVDQLTDAQVIKYQQQLRAAGMTMDQAEQMAASKGMLPDEINKLKQRIAMLNANRGFSGSKQNSDTLLIAKENPVDSIRSDKKDAPLIDPKIFGAELFNNHALVFEPNLRIATPLNYQLGPDDRLEITVYGIQEVTHSLTVSSEGNIYIPNVGQIRVGGMAIEPATSKIEEIMKRTAYPTLSGGSKLSITIGNIRSIRVTIIGGNKPGNYTMPSLSTAFNALFLCGGPSQMGSFREIELIRENKLLKKIDLYRFLSNGDQSDNINLKDNDVIRIPAYKERIQIDGYVKRPGIFELLPGEKFVDILRFASGFSDSAYKASIKVTRFTDKELQVKDVYSKEYDSYQPKGGDFYTVDKLLGRYANRVTISGAVFRGGGFELTPSMTVSDLIKKADGIREDAYTDRGQIVRVGADLTREIISFNVKNVLNGAEEIALKREDSVVIKSIFDLRDEYYISIQGEIRNPGFYNYRDNITLKDLIIQSGGLTDGAYERRIEVARLIRRDTLTTKDIRASEVITVNDVADLSASVNNVSLKPFDVITVRKKPGFQELQSVTASGQLQYPGPYVLSKREERVSDLVKRAGGFTPEAYVQGAYIKRYNDDNDMAELRKQKIAKIQSQLKDTSSKSVIQDLEKDFDQIPLNMEKLIRFPGSPEDVVLKGRDELFIPKFSAQVRVSGSVLFPTQIPYDRSYNLKKYLSAAGGVSEKGRRGKSYVLYANGKARATRYFLFFKNYPTVKPGAEIVVPEKPVNKGMTTGEVVGISSALASLAAVVVAIINLTK